MLACNFFSQIRRHELHKSKNTGKMHFGRKQDQTTGEYTLKCEEDVLVHKNYRELTLRHI